MPLTGENRTLVSLGLNVLRQTKNSGLRALMNVAAIDLNRPVGSDAIGFQLGPRLNAVGRMDDAADALRLLLTDDPSEASDLAARLDKSNRERQFTQKLIQIQAIEQVERLRIKERPVLVVYNPKWNIGVVGIVAGKLVEQYNRPAIVIGVNENGAEGKGSARSIPAYDIGSGIEACKKLGLLSKGGGHKYAAGLTIDMARFEEFYARLCEHADDAMKDIPEPFVPTLRVDAFISASDVALPMLEEWQQLQPFGAGNPAPFFAARKVQAGDTAGGGAQRDVRRIGKDRTHLKFVVRPTEGRSDCVDCVGWGMADDWEQHLADGRKVDIAFAASINEYQGRRSVQFMIKDIVASE
jgi:single-stranded-DNA-specific exonuclease